MIIKGIVTRTRPHDLRAEGYWVDMRPFALDPFTICPGHSTTEIQRPRALTLCAVAEDMEFRNDRGEKHVVNVKLHGDRKCGETTCKINTPLTSYVIRNDEHGDCYTDKCLDQNIIHTTKST